MIRIWKNQGCGSGSAWLRIHFTSWVRICIQYQDPDPGGKIFKIMTKNARKLVITASSLNLWSKFAQISIFSYFWAIFYVFYNLENSLWDYLLTNFVKLDPDPNFSSSWIRIRIQKNCWIRIRKIWMRIHSPGKNRLDLWPSPSMRRLFFNFDLIYVLKDAFLFRLDSIMNNTGAKIEMSSARDKSLTFLITGRSDSVLRVSLVKFI